MIYLTQRYQPWKLVAWSKKGKVRKMLKKSEEEEGNQKTEDSIWAGVETYEKGRGWNYWCQGPRRDREFEEDIVEIEEIE